MNEQTVTLAELGVTEDPGTAWHPHKPEAYDTDGNLRDLTDAEVTEHLAKPEADQQLDGVTVLAAEDSHLSGEGEI